MNFRTLTGPREFKFSALEIQIMLSSMVYNGNHYDKQLFGVAMVIKTFH